MELEKENMINEETVEMAKQKKLGGIKTMPFILANEICDRFAATGFHANLITYLTQQLNLPLVKASNTLTNFSGVASFMPIFGALLADSFVGRYWTILIALLIYILGMVIITISAILPQFRPQQCPTQENCKEASQSQLWVLYISLLLTSIGLGGTRPCVVAFAADQLDISKFKTQAKSWNFFNWYYFSLSLASLSALTVIVYVQDRVSWGWGLGIPTIAMAMAFVAFLVGSPLYQKTKPEGSPFVRVTQVIVAAVKKWQVMVPIDAKLLYENKELDHSISRDGRLVHTDHLRWFDKAAVITEDDTVLVSNSPKLWRIATVHRVEELKSIIRLLPIISTGIIYVMAYSHQNSFTVMQARTMDRHLSSSFQIPPASMAVFGVIGTLISLAVYDRLFVPFAYRFTNNPAGITCLQRIGVGFVINVLATFIAAFVEMKRKQEAKDHNLLDKPTHTIPISVFWLIPQYFLHGVAESFFHVGKLEFLYEQSAESMKSTALALYWIAIGIGQYAGTLMVTMVHKYTTNGRGRNWLPDRNLNRGKLEDYYMLITGIQVLNLVYYFLCAWFYTYKLLEDTVKGGEDGNLELVVDKAVIDVTNDPPHYNPILARDLVDIP
ncbi:Major facilitator superfamily domain, general substrate transporter [Cynara cardunculus var. scolymus]|uniref:Major facilitator superfamily domain, general substrate transporter n=1 Tax=Cynara cardunculus var. scolymus TaxID=59895 RepID=A0A118K7E7_CYNCS|nr:Major facilitator superfamily domain, general substrate transporter [Cynara cardunculus var. scolymus]